VVIEAAPGGADRVQHFADRHGGSDYASGDLDGDTSNDRVWLACVACGARIERPAETS